MDKETWIKRHECIGYLRYLVRKVVAKFECFFKRIECDRLVDLWVTSYHQLLIQDHLS
jgi:hypothetical protein